LNVQRSTQGHPSPAASLASLFFPERFRFRSPSQLTHTPLLSSTVSNHHQGSGHIVTQSTLLLSACLCLPPPYVKRLTSRHSTPTGQLSTPYRRVASHLLYDSANLSERCSQRILGLHSPSLCSKAAVPLSSLVPQTDILS